MARNISTITFFVLISHSLSFSQTTHDLQKTPDLTMADVNSISEIADSDHFKPVYYSKNEGFTIDPSPASNSEIWGCKGDFNNDGVTDFAVIMRNLMKNKDELRSFVTGLDTVFTLYTIDPLPIIRKRNRTSINLNPPRCYRKSESGQFVGLEGKKYVMSGDLINYSWYSFLWNGKNGFKRIQTSD